MKHHRIPVAACAICIALLTPPRALAAPAGTLDPTFGIGGRRTVALPEPLDTAIATRPGFAIRTAAGQLYLIDNPYAGQGNGQILQIVRLHHEGAVDNSFGQNGIVSVVLPDALGGGVSAAALQDDGRIVIGLSNPDMVVCRLMPSGALDATFGPPETPGCVDAGGGFVEAVLVQLDGKIVVAGTSDQRGRVTRLLRDGATDATFGEDGTVLLDPIVSTEFNDVALASNGDIVAAGSIFLGDSDFLIVRLDGATGERVDDFGDEGVLRMQFNAGGPNHDAAYALAVLPDGGIVAAGYATTDLDGNYSSRPSVVKLTENGERDESFGPSGERVYDPCSGYAFGCDVLIRDIAVLPDERLVLAGDVEANQYPSADFLSMRIRADGTPDPDFGNFGTAGTSVIEFDLGQQSNRDSASTVLLEGERVLLTGYASVATSDPAYDRVDFALVRLDHGKNNVFIVTPVFGANGSLSPTAPQQVGHSQRAEFAVLPDPGYVVAAIGTDPDDCGGGMDGDVYVTAPVIKSCTARITFKPVDPAIFANGFE